MGHHQLDELDYKTCSLERSDTISRSCKGMQCIGGRYSSTGTKIDEFGDS